MKLYLYYGVMIYNAIAESNMRKLQCCLKLKQIEKIWQFCNLKVKVENKDRSKGLSIFTLFSALRHNENK